MCGGCQCLPGSRQLWVTGRVCSCGCGQLFPPAHASLAGPRQVVPQPVGVPVNSGTQLWALRFRLLPCPVPGRCLVPLFGAISSPLCVFICKCSCSGCGFSRWCCLRDRSDKKNRWGRSPSPACSSHPSRSSASSSSASLDAGVQAGEMPPPLAGRLGAVGSGGDCSASGHVRSPRPGPSGQSLWLVTMSYNERGASKTC